MTGKWWDGKEAMQNSDHVRLDKGLCLTCVKSHAALKNPMLRDSAWKTALQLLFPPWRTHRPTARPTTTTGTRWVSSSQLSTLCVDHSFKTFVLLTVPFPPPSFVFSSNSTAAGDRTPGDSTTNTASIASTTPLLRHDVQIPDRWLGGMRPFGSASEHGVMEFQKSDHNKLISSLLV